MRKEGREAIIAYINDELEDLSIPEHKIYVKAQIKQLKKIENKENFLRESKGIIEGDPNYVWEFIE